MRFFIPLFYKTKIKAEKMAKKLTTEEFKTKAIEVHCGKYLYDNVVYVNNSTDVEIICPIHGSFFQKPINHLRGCGCKECAKEEKSKKQRSTKEDFIKRANLVHNNEYEYDLVDYVNANTKVKIRCKTCNQVFEQTPASHLEGRGCTFCYGNLNMGFDTFMKKAIEVHGEEMYDYSESVYVNSRTPICIICKQCGERFWQTPRKHLLGQGCKTCATKKRAKKRTKEQEEFVRQANIVHNNRYLYDSVVYVNTHKLVNIRCPQHGTFPQTPKAHLNGQGCPICGMEISADKRRLNLSEFVAKAQSVHPNKYGYDNAKYVNTSTPLEIFCPIHGPFLQDPHNHLQGSGCPKCANNLSKAENDIADFIRGLGLNVEQHNRKILDGLEIDIYIPSLKIGIEYNGLYWHHEGKGKDRQYHLRKTKNCEKQGIRLIQIFEDEWVNRKEITLSRLKTILGKNDNKVYARNCQIKIVNNKISQNFLDKNHLQGGCVATHCLGLYYKYELVSLMTFGPMRQRKKSVDVYDRNYELVRFCNKVNTTIVGGASKLLNHFIQEVKPKSITTYADRRWSDGGLYFKLGFIHTHNSAPNYFYVVGGKREHRFKFRKNKLVKQGFNPNKSEHEIMLEQGIFRIYDCGNMVFKMEFDN